MFKFLIISYNWQLFRDKDLLLVPYCSNDVSVIQWPPFLLASKVFALHCFMCNVSAHLRSCNLYPFLFSKFLCDRFL